MGNSIVVPIYQSVDILAQFLTSLERTIAPSTQVIFVNDGSGSAVTEVLRRSGVKLADERLSEVEILEHSVPAGCGQSLNDGLARAHGDVVIFCDSDLILSPDWQESITRAATSPSRSTSGQSGMAGSVLLYPQTGGVQHAGLRFSPTGARHWKLNAKPEELGPELIKVQAAAFALFAVTRQVLDAVDGLDERYLNGYEDLDFQMRARRAGFHTVVDPTVWSYHWEFSNGPHRATNRKANLARFWAQWGHAIEDDLTPSVAGEIRAAAGQSGSTRVIDLVESRVDAIATRAALGHDEARLTVDWLDCSSAIHDGQSLTLARCVPRELSESEESLVLLVENFVRALDNEKWMRDRLGLGSDDVVVDMYGNRFTVSSLLAAQWPGRKVR